jgi:hypothetical protein
MGRGKKKELPKSMCLLSALYDPVNYLTLDVQTGPTDGNEQDLLLKHLPKVERGDILLLDRGYPGTALFSGLQSKGIHFIVRMKQNWLPVKEFMASRKRDTIVTLTAPDKYYDSYKEQVPFDEKGDQMQTGQDSAGEWQGGNIRYFLTGHGKVQAARTR